MGSLHFSVTTITDHRMPHGRAIRRCISSGCLMGKTQEKRQRHNIAGLLAVATVFIGSWTLNIYILL